MLQDIYIAKIQDIKHPTFEKERDLILDIGYCIYRVSHEEWTKLRESVPYVKIYRCNPKHLYPKSNGYGDNGQRSLKL